MALYRLIMGLFTKRKKCFSNIDQAISEGIKDVFKEMGYHFKEKHKA